MKTYHGERRRTGGASVHVETKNGHRYPLNPRNDLANHSPDGFEWGYGGSGPAQLALAILSDLLGDEGEAEALKLHQRFKERWVAGIPTDEWMISEREIKAMVNDLRLETDVRPMSDQERIQVAIEAAAELHSIERADAVTVVQTISRRLATAKERLRMSEASVRTLQAELQRRPTDLPAQ